MGPSNDETLALHCSTFVVALHVFGLCLGVDFVRVQCILHAYS